MPQKAYCGFQTPLFVASILPLTENVGSISLWGYC